MRLLHLADLHLGKRVNGFNMIEDQTHALKEIINLIDQEEIEGVLISGDVYDVTVPSAEAMNLFDWFITSLNVKNAFAIIISGNHDSADRLSFGKSLMQSSNIYISQVYDKQVEKIVLNDQYGPINFYMLPFIKPAMIKKDYPDLDLGDFTSAISNVMQTVDLNKSQRNILLAHQFIVGAKTSESEELYLGGLEAVSWEHFKDFDYVAMGHLHKKQTFNEGKIRYPGSLLKYSQSEENNKKTITMLDIREKNNIVLEEKTIDYLRDLRTIRGKFSDIIENSIKDENKDDYIFINLIDQDEVLDGLTRLREIYPNIMALKYENSSSILDEPLVVATKSKDPYALFEEFYQYRNNRPLDESKAAIIKDLIGDIWSSKEE